MKQIIVVSKGNVAIAHGGAQDLVARGEGTFLANIQAVNAVMETIPTEVAETTHIYVQGVLAGIANGACVDYIKTGKSGSGSELTTEEVEEFKKFYGLYAERILNVRFSQHKFMSREDVAGKKLVAKAWEVLNKELAKGVTQTVVTQTVVDPDASIRAELDKQIIEALQAKDFATVKQLQEIRANLSTPTVVESTSTVQGVAPQVNKPASAPNFSSAEDKAFSEEEITGEDEEISFDAPTGNAQQPTW